MTPLQSTIRKWAENGQSPEEARNILQNCHPNRITARSARKFKAEKLRYELLKLYGVKPSMIWTAKCSTIELLNRYDQTHEKKNTNPAAGGRTQNTPAEKTQKSEADADLGNAVLQAKALSADLSADISMLHDKAYEVGISKDEKSNRARARINEEKRALITLRETLYFTKEEAVMTGRSDKLKLKIQEVRDAVSGKTQPKPDKREVGKMTDIQLQKAYHNATGNIRKKLNMLEYQQKSKAQKPNPMPKGTRRTKLEGEIKELTELKKRISEEIKKRGL